MTKKTSSPSPSASEQPMRRREFLSLTAGAAVALQFGITGCGTPGDNNSNDNSNANSNTNDNSNVNNNANANTNQGSVECKTDPSQDKGKVVTLDAASISQNDKQFSIGVQTGLMAPTSALVWSFTEDKLAKHLKVWRETDKANEVAVVFDKEVEPKEGFFHISVEGLAPGTRYNYAFLEGKEDSWTGRSRIGSFRTAFADDCLEPITIAATACTNYKKFKEFKALDIMAKEEFDLFCHLGDFSYNDGASNPEEYHEKWKATLQTPGYAELLARSGLYATWDDHEVINDDKLYKQTPEFRKMARDSYLQHVPQPQDRPGGAFWASYRWGKTAEFFVLDCRGERVPDEKIYISKEQMDWVKKALSDSPCHFKVVLNSVPIIAWPSLWKIALKDRWEGYPKQRDELLDHITSSNIKNVWFLGGDYHVGVVAKVEKEGPRSNLWEIMVGPGGNKVPSSLLSLLEFAKDDMEAVAPAAQFDLFNPHPAATMITFDPASDTVHVKFTDPETNKVVFDKKLSQSKS